MTLPVCFAGAEGGGSNLKQPASKPKHSSGLDSVVPGAGDPAGPTVHRSKRPHGKRSSGSNTVAASAAAAAAVLAADGGTAAAAADAAHPGSRQDLDRAAVGASGSESAEESEEGLEEDAKADTEEKEEGEEEEREEEDGDDEGAEPLLLSQGAADGQPGLELQVRWIPAARGSRERVWAGCLLSS